MIERAAPRVRHAFGLDQVEHGAVVGVEPGSPHAEVRPRAGDQSQHPVEVHALAQAIGDDGEMVHAADHGVSLSDIRLARELARPAVHVIFSRHFCDFCSRKEF
ncbi:hypothetical protein D3C77_678090 [compost metagenome]